MFLAGRPTGTHLDPQLQEDLGLHQALEFLAGFAADALEALAAAADDHALVGVTLDHDGGADAAHLAFLFPFVDDHGRGVGELIAGQAEQLLADDLAGQELLAAVGQCVFFVVPVLLGQVGLEDGKQPVHVGLLLRRHGHVLGKRMTLLHALEPRQEIAATLDLVELVRDQHHRLALGDQGQHLGVVHAKTAGFHQEQHQVHIRQRGLHGAVEVAVERGGVLHLEARRVDEDELRFFHRAHPGDAMPGGLRLLGRDADLLAHQGVHQRGLADIGPAHDGDQAAARRRRVGVAGFGGGRGGGIHGVIVRQMKTRWERGGTGRAARIKWRRPARRGAGASVARPVGR